MTTIEEQSISKQLSYVAKELERNNLTLSELLALHSTIEILILKNPKSQKMLRSKLSQINLKIAKRRPVSSITERLIARYEKLTKKNLFSLN